MKSSSFAFPESPNERITSEGSPSSFEFQALRSSRLSSPARTRASVRCGSPGFQPAAGPDPFHPPLTDHPPTAERVPNPSRPDPPSRLERRPALSAQPRCGRLSRTDGSESTPEARAHPSVVGRDPRKPHAGRAPARSVPPSRRVAGLALRVQLQATLRDPSSVVGQENAPRRFIPARRPRSPLAALPPRAPWLSGGAASPHRQPGGSEKWWRRWWRRTIRAGRIQTPSARGAGGGATTGNAKSADTAAVPGTPSRTLSRGWGRSPPLCMRSPSSPCRLGGCPIRRGTRENTAGVDEKEKKAWVVSRSACARSEIETVDPDRVWSGTGF